MEFRETRGVVEELDLSSGCQGCETAGRIVEMLIVAQNKLLEGRRDETSFGTTVLESLPPGGNRCINVDENKERPMTKCFDSSLVIDRSHHVVGLPVLRDPIDQIDDL